MVDGVIFHEVKRMEFTQFFTNSLILLGKGNI